MQKCGDNLVNILKSTITRVCDKEPENDLFTLKKKVN